MLDPRVFQLTHLHGGERYPMHEREPHDAAELDPERRWAAGARIFRCSACGEEIAVTPPDADLPGSEPA